MKIKQNQIAGLLFKRYRGKRRTIAFYKKVGRTFSSIVYATFKIDWKRALLVQRIYLAFYSVYGPDASYRVMNPNKSGGI